MHPVEVREQKTTPPSVYTYINNNNNNNVSSFGDYLDRQYGAITGKRRG